MLEIEALATNLVGPIDLTLAAGECVAVSGASGSGKSLMLRAIADMDPCSGKVMLDGTLRQAMAATEWRRRVALVPAESGWWSDRVADHFPIDGLDGEGLRRLLSDIGLPDALGWSVARLSTGERQRLALARALARGPSILLLDEPTSALDMASTRRIEALLFDKIADGVGLLFITHDPEQAVRFGAVTRVMEAGLLSPAEAGA